MLYNPAFSEAPRHQLAPLIPLRQDTSIINWLQQTGRMMPRDIEDDKYLDEDVEISELLTVEYASDDFESNDDLEMDPSIALEE